MYRPVSPSQWLGPRVSQTVKSSTKSSAVQSGHPLRRKVIPLVHPPLEHRDDARVGWQLVARVGWSLWWMRTARSSIRSASVFPVEKLVGTGGAFDQIRRGHT